MTRAMGKGGGEVGVRPEGLFCLLALTAGASEKIFRGKVALEFSLVLWAEAIAERHVVFALEFSQVGRRRSLKVTWILGSSFPRLRGGDR